MSLVETFQSRVAEWIEACFGKKIATDKTERTHRFVEEALELAQAFGCKKSQIIELVEYVYSRPVGEVRQEVGGTMLTLAALCNTDNIDMIAMGEDELNRVWENLDFIQKKRTLKQFKSSLP